MQRSIPLWTRAVLLLLALATLRSLLPGSIPDDVRARAAELVVERDPRRMSARELRQLPGVGHKLALALASARDLHRGERPLAWEDVPGIGDVRAREIRAWFRARGIDPDPLGPGERPARAGYPVGVSKLPFLVRAALAVFLAACGDTTGGGGAPVAPVTPAPSEPAQQAAIQARTLALQGGALHALEAGRADGPGAQTVLLLHGARYSAQTWQELGTLERLARAGHRAVAIDWPGYGATPEWSAQPEADTLIGAVCDELGAKRIVLVAPSLGGRFAFEFLRHSAARAAGLVAIAPAGSKEFGPDDWRTPTLLLWGERDDVVPLNQGRALAARLRARLEVLPGASHPCYLDQPDRFHALLLEFLASVRTADGAEGQ